MKPRICYKHKCSNTSRYVLLYHDAKGYKNNMWTSFDLSLQKHIEKTLQGYSVVAHTYQPYPQVNDKSFIKNMEDIFKNENIFKKELEVKNESGILSKMIGFIWKNDNRFYLSCLDINNRSKFFDTKGFGCFWYIFILRHEDYLKTFISSLNRESINKDEFFSKNKEVPCVFYRDYLKNSISIMSNDEVISAHIEEYINNEKTPIFDKYINNIFDNTYIEGIYSSDIRE